MIDLSNPGRPISHSVLYLRRSTDDAAPKCISRRTSYLRVRLAFHPYPHLIRAFFNIHRFGPPRGITPASTWTWVDHTVSGLTPATQALERANALFALAFAAPPWLNHLSSQHTLTRRLILQKARCHTEKDMPPHSAPTACRRRGFRNCFTPLPGCFSPFPHGTISLSVAKGI